MVTVPKKERPGDRIDTGLGGEKSGFGTILIKNKQGLSGKKRKAPLF